MELRFHSLVESITEGQGPASSSSAASSSFAGSVPTPSVFHGPLPTEYAEAECPKCGADVYDNTKRNEVRIRSGTRPMPQFMCILCGARSFIVFASLILVDKGIFVRSASRC